MEEAGEGKVIRSLRNRIGALTNEARGACLLLLPLTNQGQSPQQALNPLACRSLTFQSLKLEVITFHYYYALRKRELEIVSSSGSLSCMGWI